MQPPAVPINCTKSLFNIPHVRHIVGSVETVGRPFAPAVEAPLRGPHEVFAGKYWMLFHSNDRLAEIQLLGLED
jgi:hypothetical protein